LTYFQKSQPKNKTLCHDNETNMTNSDLFVELWPLLSGPLIGTVFELVLEIITKQDSKDVPSFLAVKKVD
jgi:hypothetical protein